MNYYDDLIDNIITDQSPSEISNDIENILYAKIGEKINDMEPNVAAAFFGMEEDVDLEELYKGRHGQTEKQYMDARSDAGKRISGDSQSGPRAYSVRGSVKDAPTQPGQRPINTPKLRPYEKNEIQIRRNELKKKLTEAPWRVYSKDDDGNTVYHGRPLKTFRGARKKVDKLDQEVGGYRHGKHWVPDPKDPSLTQEKDIERERNSRKNK